MIFVDSFVPYGLIQSESVSLTNSFLIPAPTDGNSIRFSSLQGVHGPAGLQRTRSALPELLERIGEAFADSGLPYEVVIVDDGSSDDTAKIASQMSFQMPIHLVQHEQNQGLGRRYVTDFARRSIVRVNATSSSRWMPTTRIRPG